MDFIVTNPICWHKCKGKCTEIMYIYPVNRILTFVLKGVNLRATSSLFRNYDNVLFFQEQIIRLDWSGFFPAKFYKVTKTRQDIKMMLALQERRIKSLLSTPDKLSKIILTEKIIKSLLFYYKKHKSTSQHNFTQLHFKDFCSDIFLLDQFPLLYFLEANAKLILTSKKCSK